MLPGARKRSPKCATRKGCRGLNLKAGRSRPGIQASFGALFLYPKEVRVNIIEKKIKEIVPYENNPRKNDSAVAAVAKSIESFGFKVPIVIDKDGVIVCGHTRLKAAKKLKLSSVPCVVADDLTEEQIKAFRLADNKTAELAEWDFDLLSGELLELDNLGIDMADFGFGSDVVSVEEEYERKKQEFQKRMAEGELSEDSEEYQEFLAKFEAKKTTDDCYTPENIYEAVADYVSEHYGVKKVILCVRSILTAIIRKSHTRTAP